MVPRRSLAVFVAIVMAAIASAAAYAELHSAQQRAYRNSKLTSVFVVKAVVPRDDSAAAAYAQGLIQATKMPVQFVPAGAVTKLSVLSDHVAGSDLPVGEVVVSGMFVSPTSIPSVAAQTVPKGDVAVSVSVDQVHSVAGLVQPGDKVDILVDINGDSESYLYQSVPVLAVGTTLVTAPGTKTQTSAPPEAMNVITFAVSKVDAARIALANSGGDGVTGGVYLTLQAASDAAESTTIIPGTNLIPGSNAITGSNLVTGSPTAPGATISSSNTAPTHTSGGARNEPTP